uniref:Tubulin--tyrosine ligase-like protein 12 SET-like domain-containing protein n=1 Tax=Plectus sambesii TaxID=2011161 RepID=A0A914V9A3_9BILA
MSGLTVEDFIAGHQGQLVSANVPQHFWSRLHDKLMGEVFDAGDYFQIICEESADDGRKNWQVVLTKDLEANDPNGIFLVDHAWTFRPQLARRHLGEVPGLLDRMSAFLGHDDDEAEEVDPRRRTDRVLRDLWRHAQTYTIRRPGATTDEDQMPVWYMADEFGSRIPHSDEPTVRMVPIYYAPQQIAFSLVFPLQSLKEGDLVTRDYADSATARARPNWRHLLLHPWTPIDISHQSMENVEPTEDFFLSGRTMDELPSGTVVRNVPIKLEDSDLKLKIFADDFQLIKHLIHVQYEVVEDMKDADVVWLRTHFHKFKELSVINPNALVNQFPFESILTVKDLLAV